MKEMKRKSKKQGGFVLTSELVLIVTIMVMGLTVGLVTMRDALTGEMEDVAEAVGALDQSYAFNGLANPQTSAATEGSSWGDATDVFAGDTGEFSYLAVDSVEGSSLTPGLASSSAANPGDVAVGTLVTP